MGMLKMNTLQKKLENSLEIKYYNKYLQNKSIQFNNKQILFIGFIDFMLQDKNLLLEYTKSFSPNKYKKNDKYYYKNFNRI